MTISLQDLNPVAPVFVPSLNTLGTVVQKSAETAVFIPGASSKDSLRDRLFFQLYEAGKIDPFGYCLESDTWEKPNFFSALERQEILSFLKRDIEIKSEGRTACINLFELFTYLLTKSQGCFYLFGSHLREIANKHNWTLNNLQKLLKDPILPEIFTLLSAQKAGDSDWRFYPQELTKENILRLTQEVLEFFRISLYPDQRDVTLKEAYQQRQKIRGTSLSKFHVFDSRKNEHDPVHENTIYSTISFGNIKDKPIDLMFVQNVLNPCLFNLDDLTLNTHEQQPKSSTNDNSWQYIVDQSLYLLHCPNIDLCDDMGWLRLLRHLSKGGRFLEARLDQVLFNKIPPFKHVSVISKYFNKMIVENPDCLVPLYCHILMFLAKQPDKTILNDVKVEIEPLLPEIQKPKNSFEWLVKLSKEPLLDFNSLLSLMHATLFLHLNTSSSKVCITRMGESAALELSEDHFFYTSGSIPDAISHFSTLPANKIVLLEDFFEELLPFASYSQEKDEILESRLEQFGLSFAMLIDIGEAFLTHENKLLQKFGIHCLLFSLSYAKDQIKALKPVFNALLKENNFSELNLLNQCIAHLDFTSTPLVLSFWLKSKIEEAKKKNIGLKLFQKIASSDFVNRQKLFQSLVLNPYLSLSDAELQLKELCRIVEKDPSLEKIILLAQAMKSYFSFIQNKKAVVKEQLTAIEKELHFLTQQLLDAGLTKEAEDFLPKENVSTNCLNSLEKNLARKDMKAVLTEILDHSKNETLFKSALEFIIERLNNLGMECSVIVKKMLTEKAASLLEYLFNYLAHDLFISLLLALNNRNIKIPSDEKTIGFVLQIVENGLEEEPTFKTVHQLSLELKLYTWKKSEQFPKIKNIYNSLATKLIQRDQIDAMKHLLDLLMRFDEPDFETFNSWITLLSANPNQIAIYFEITELLCKYFKKGALSVILKIVSIGEALMKQKNLEPSIKFRLIVLQKWLNIQDIAVFEDGLRMLHTLVYDLSFLRNKSNIMKEEIEKVLLLSVSAANKYDQPLQVRIQSTLESIFITLSTKSTETFESINRLSLFKEMMKTKSSQFFLLCGSFILHMLFPLTTRAEEPLRQLSIQWMEKAMENLKTLKLTLEDIEKRSITPESLLRRFAFLEHFSLHFDPSLKNKIYLKCLSCQLETALNSPETDLEFNEKILRNMGKCLPLVEDNPELEHEYVDKAFTLLISFVTANRLDLFNFFLVHLFSVLMKKELTMLPQNTPFSEEIDDPARYLKLILLISSKLLKVPLTDKRIINGVYASCKQNISMLIEALNSSSQLIKSVDTDKKDKYSLKQFKDLLFSTTVDLLEQFIFWKPAQSLELIDDHIQVLKSLLIKAQKEDLFKTKPKMYRLLTLYLDLHPLMIMGYFEANQYDGLTKEVEDVLIKLLESNSPATLLRAIALYQSSQNLIVEYPSGKNKRKPIAKQLIEANTLLNYFRLICSSLTKNHFPDIILGSKPEDENLHIYQMKKKSKKGEKVNESQEPNDLFETKFIFKHFQEIFLANPHITTPLLRSLQWSKVFSEMCDEWNGCLVKIYEQRESKVMKYEYFTTWHQFLVTANQLNGFTPGKYLIALTEFYGRLVTLIDQVKYNPVDLEMIFTEYLSIDLFNIKFSNNTERKAFAKVKAKVIEQLTELNSPEVNTFLKTLK